MTRSPDVEGPPDPGAHGSPPPDAGPHGEPDPDTRLDPDIQPDVDIQPDPDAASPSVPAGETSVSRRRFLAYGAAMMAAGAVLGAAAVIAAAEVSNRGAVTPSSRPTDASPGPAPSPTTGPSSPAASGQATPPPAGPTPSDSGSAGSSPGTSGASPEPIESPPAPGPGRAGRENLRKGTAAWEQPLRAKGNAEAYTSDASVTVGDPIQIRVSSPDPRATITAYRLGWYGGQGARVVARWRDLPLENAPPPTTDSVTGLIRADWPAAVNTVVPEGWVSGLYLGVVSPSNGAPQYCTFVVREPVAAAPILFVSATTTHQAYNNWGGKSLYPDESSGASTVAGGPNAVTVSWDRPYAAGRGAGLVLRWEYPFVRWMESRGYDVGYAADFDLERHPELVAGRRLIVFAGHPEYWSPAMRATLEGAIAAGTSVAFFSANEMYWRVRFDQATGGRFRTVTCYRRADIDPLAAADPAGATTQWRGAPNPRPESLVIGQMYGHVVLTSADFVCTAPDHWIYHATGMRFGDTIASLVGQEYDRFWPGDGLSPPGTQILATSPVTPNLGRETGAPGSPTPAEPVPAVHNATIYSAPSGATVFSAGTIQWSWALDGWGAPDWAGVRTPLDWRVARITANILDRLGGLSA